VVAKYDGAFSNRPDSTGMINKLPRRAGTNAEAAPVRTTADIAKESGVSKRSLQESK